MFETDILIASIIFGSIGLGYFIYGKGSSKYVTLASGLILMTYPYFVTNIYYNVAIGLVFTIIPFIIKI